MHQNKTNDVSYGQKHMKKKKAIDLPNGVVAKLLLASGVLALAFFLYLLFIIGSTYIKVTSRLKNVSNTSKTFISPTPLQNPTPTDGDLYPTHSKPLLFPLRISVVDFSQARPAGIVTNLNIKLFSEKGELIEEKKPSETVQTGQVGSGGDAVFNVQLGKYRAVAEGDGKKGSVDIAIDSFDSQNGYTIYLVGSSMKISGKYFLDSNKNTQYDQGEVLFANKEVNAIVDTEGRIYTAYQTKTDDKGNFEMYPSIFGKYSLTGEQINNYKIPPTFWVDMTGNRSIELSLYLWE